MLVQVSGKESFVWRYSLKLLNLYLKTVNRDYIYAYNYISNVHAVIRQWLFQISVQLFQIINIIFFRKGFFN